MKITEKEYQLKKLEIAAQLLVAMHYKSDQRFAMYDDHFVSTYQCALNEATELLAEWRNTTEVHVIE